MNQYGGTSMPPLAPAPVYGQVPQHPMNGYESHNAAGYGQPLPPPPLSASKGFPQPPYTGSTPGAQNGLAPRNAAPYNAPTSAYNQNISPNAPPPPSSAAPDQLTHRFGDMSMNTSVGYPPGPMPGPPRMSTPGADNYRPPPPQQQQPPPPREALHQPYSQLPSSVSGSYRLSHPPIQQTPAPTSHATTNPSGMPLSSGQFQSDQMKQFMGTAQPMVSQPPSTMASGQYGTHNVVPPTSMHGPPPPDLQQNGPYYQGGDLPPPPGGGHPPTSYVDQPNGHTISPDMQPFPAQMPMQSRYPPMPPAQNIAQGMPPLPPQPQYMPPGGGQNRMASSMPSTAPPPQPPVSQARKLDPDHMPSPIQVIEDDKKQHSGPFMTNTRGAAPPLVTTDFTVTDGGICSPRYMRSTIYTVPTAADILKQTSVPFAIVLSPFAELCEGEQPPHISDLGESGPVRCIRCKAYMCPFMQFIDGGRRFQCIFCKATTEVPVEYFSHLGHMGERVDKYQRPELCLGSYEFIATKEYCKNSTFPNCPAFIFAIDVSYNSIRNGMVQLLCDNMKSIFENLPSEDNEPSKIKVGFITYSNVVHFYNIKSVLAQPQVMVVPDVHEMFMPLLDGFLVDYNDAEPVITSLLQQIPDMFAETRETETLLGPAIQAGLEALKAADCSGKLFVFHSSLPIAEAPGKLKNRDDRKLLGTEKEKTILTPQIPFYNSLGQECVAAGCCVDLFLFPNAYIDIATLGQVCRLTGGQVYKYTYFQADNDGTRFLEDLKRDVSKPIAFDSIIRVRTSTGIRPTEFWGNFFMSNTTDIEIAAIDCDKALAVEIKFDDKLGEDDGAYIQAAVLYTSCRGQRRLRVHNLALNTSSQMSELFRNCELDAVMNVFSKEAIRMIVEQTPRQVKDHFVQRSAQILACYRKHCANRSSVGQLILPECMKLLPLYINCLIKSDAISGQEMSTDDRSFTMLALNSMDISSSVCNLYPRLLPLHDINTATDELPVAMRCSYEKIKENGVYLIENGIFMMLWVGMAVNVEWIQDVFAVPTVGRIDVESSVLIELNTPLSKRVRGIIRQVQKERQRHMKLIIMRQGDKLELVFRQFLVEDHTTENSASYVDFLCHLHKEIRSLLT